MHTLYTRINTGLLVFIALTGIVLVTMMATRAYGGPLDPPGAPASTMKTLQQVEPRTPIVQPGNVSEFPITISEPAFARKLQPDRMVTVVVGGMDAGK